MDRRPAPNAAVPGSDPLDALVVLGCRVRGGLPSRALESRLELARQLGEESMQKGDRPSPIPIVLSGGRRWDGEREADVMAKWLIARGIPEDALVLEGESMTTGQNARKVATLLSGRGWGRIGLVTSDFHMSRAARLFRGEGMAVVPFAAPHSVGFLTEKRLLLRELGAMILGRFEPR